MASTYQTGGRSAATAATADNFGAALWNPHASKPIRVREIWWFKTVATADSYQVARITARGTSTLTVTPDIDNDRDRLLAPGSGALLDLTYSGQPTLQAPPLHRGNLPAVIGAGFIKVFDPPIRIAAGEGIGIAVPTGLSVVLQPADITFVWEE